MAQNPKTPTTNPPPTQRDDALSEAALDQVSGGTDPAPTTTSVSNVLKTKHDTAKNSISNVR